MKRLLVCLILLSGCSSLRPGTQAPGQSGQYRKNLARMPMVAIVGDQLLVSLDTPLVQSQNPLWTFYPPDLAALETSGATLLRVPAILATRPDVLVILTGTFDTTTQNWIAPCGEQNDAPVQTCENIHSMVMLAHQSGVKVIVSGLPGVSDGSAGTPLLDLYPWMPGDIVEYNRSFNAVAPVDPTYQDADLNMQMVLGNTPASDDGLDFSPAGAQLVTTALRSIIATLHVGSVR